MNKLIYFKVITILLALLCVTLLTGCKRYEFDFENKNIKKIVLIDEEATDSEITLSENKIADLKADLSDLKFKRYYSDEKVSGSQTIKITYEDETYDLITWTNIRKYDADGNHLNTYKYKCDADDFADLFDKYFT